MAAPTSTGQVSLSGGTSTLSAMMLRVLRRVGDNPYTDTHTNAYTAGGTSLTVVSDATQRWEAGDLLDWPYDGSTDAAVVTTSAATTLTIRTGHSGTTSANHSANAVIRKNPLLLTQEYSDFVLEAVQALFPDITHIKQATYNTPSTPALQDVIWALPTDAERVFRVYQRTQPTGGIMNTYDRDFSIPRWFDSTWVTTKKALRIPFLDTSITDVTTFYVIYGAQHTVTDLTARQQDIVVYEAAANALETLQDRDRTQSDAIVQDASNRIQLYRARARQLRSLERKHLDMYWPYQDKNLYVPRHVFTAQDA